MLRVRLRKSNAEWLLIGVFYIFLLQNPISQVVPLVSYAEELFSLFGICIIGCGVIQSGKLVVKKNTANVVMLLLAFVSVGLYANAHYGYQKTSLVLLDVLTNLKFYFSIITGYMLFRYAETQSAEKAIVEHARVVSLLFFALFWLDFLFHVFPSLEVRYGLRVVQLFYTHPTYLAAATVFLLSVLMLFYQKQNNGYIVMDLIVLFSTLRGKAIAGAVVYAIIFYFIIIYRKKLRVWHIVLIGAAALFVAWEQFAYYYMELEGRSARSALTITSFEILKDYFPIGTGFGTFASHSSVENYSPIYSKYGISNVWGLSESYSAFVDDTFWPIIIGQTGTIGTVCYVAVLGSLFWRVLKIRKTNIPAYAGGIFIFAYLLISSTSEPAFNNAIAVPLAMMLGYIFTLENKRPKEEAIQT